MRDAATFGETASASDGAGMKLLMPMPRMRTRDRYATVDFHRLRSTSVSHGDVVAQGSVLESGSHGSDRRQV